jgi:hypothetical protein
MKALEDKNRVLWLLLLLAVLSAIAVYRIGFHIPVPGFNEEAVTSLKQGQSQEAQTKPNGAEPATSTDSPESVLQPSHTADLRQERLTQRRYRSQNPLYFCVAFRAEGGDSMLGVIDESGGTSAGYDIAYIDENMNGDLTDEAPKKFSRREQGSRAGELDPRFEFMGPFKGEERAKYTLDIYSLAYKNRKAIQGNDYYFFWFLDIKEWNYFFINGKMKLFSNAADALKGPPVRLGGRCKWEISSRTQDGKPMISAGLKDENGCTLRIVRRAGETISPTLTLIQDGQVKAEEKMKFG